MLLYIEGVDRSGKSTIARELVSFLGLPYYRKVPPESLPLSEHHAFFKGVGFALTELHELFGWSAIVDRSFVSDWVYSNRASQRYPLRIWQEWEFRHKDPYSVRIIYVEAPVEVIATRLAAEPDPYMSSDDIVRFFGLYENYFVHTRFKVIRVSGIADGTQRAYELDIIRQSIKL